MVAKFNRTVLMTGTDYFDDTHAINPFMNEQVPIDREVAQTEHGFIQQALKEFGVEVDLVPPPKGCQDGVYTANWGLGRGDTVVLSRLPSARQAEEAYAARVLLERGKTLVHVPNNWHFSGQGDALQCGNYLFAGQGYRSDPRAQQFAADTLGYQLVLLQTVPLLDRHGKPVINKDSGWPDSYWYDIDLSLSVLKQPSDGQKGLIAWCPAAFTPESQAILDDFDAVDKIEVSLAEAKRAYACNLVSTGEAVIMNAGAPHLAANLRAHGLNVKLLHNPELAKGGGSIRCTTFTLD